MRADAVGIGAVEERGVRGDAESGFDSGLDSVDGLVVSAFATNAEIVVLALAINVNREGEVFARLEEMELFFEQQRVGAEIDVLFARDEPLDDFVDLGMHQRLAAGDGDHRRAALIYGFEAFFRAKFFLQNVRGILDLAAARTSEVAAEERLE